MPIGRERDDFDPDPDDDGLHPEGPSADEIAASRSDGYADEDEGTFACPECGREVYADASKCPGCGRLFEAGERRRNDTWWLAIGGLVLAIGMAIARMWRRMR